MPHTYSSRAPLSLPCLSEYAGKRSAYTVAVITVAVITLTVTAVFSPTDRHMLGRSRLCLMVVGFIRERELCIRIMVAGGADAVSAMNGALVSDLISPILSYAFRNLGPLRKKLVIWSHFC